MEKLHLLQKALTFLFADNRIMFGFKRHEIDDESC